MSKYLVVLAGLAILGGVWDARAAEPSIGAATTVGESTRKLTALGTVEPAEVVEVCAQVPDRIVSLGVDPHADGNTIDYGSSVDVGTVLAQLDSALYMIRVGQEQAGVALAEAELARAKAHLEAADFQRKRSESGAPSSSETARFDHKAAQASVAAAEAALAQKKATLKEARIKLSYTTIKSPIKGVVIARRANVGQMAMAGPNVPSLFLIADIKKLQVWASVNEADIGRIHPQQRVRITVAACPGKVFEGEVKQVRLNATMVQNAVAYTVVVAVTSPIEGLLPYMTARLEFDGKK